MPTLDIYKTRIAEFTTQQFIDNCVDTCASLQEDLDVLLFAFLLFDESTPEYRKLLRDSDYSDAIEAASGKHLVFFTLSERIKPQPPLVETRIDFATEDDPLADCYSRVLDAIFDDHMSGWFPSVLLFQVVDGSIQEYRVVSLPHGTARESLDAMTTLFKNVAGCLDGIAPENYNNKTEIFDVVVSDIENRELRTYIFNGPATVLDFFLRIKKYASLV